MWFLPLLNVPQIIFEKSRQPLPSKATKIAENLVPCRNRRAAAPTWRCLLQINGPGSSDLTIDAGGGSRIFDVDDGTPNVIEVEISGLKLTGGNAPTGGAIRSEEVLTVRSYDAQGPHFAPATLTK